MMVGKDQIAFLSIGILHIGTIISEESLVNGEEM